MKGTKSSVCSSVFKELLETPKHHSAVCETSRNEFLTEKLVNYLIQQTLSDY